MDLKDQCWRDITDEFKQCIKQLNLGELMTTKQFTLLESMSAIELMDPRMDGGMIIKKTNRSILNLEQSISSGLVKINNLTYEELIGIIDDTYVCLTTWLDGNYMLDQTVMTNLYLHDTERIEDKCLRIFCQAILKIVDFMDRLVMSVYCIEEEDFQANHSKWKLGSHLNEQKVLTSLEDLCHHYEKLIAEQQQHGKANSNLTIHSQQLSNDSEKTLEQTLIMNDTDQGSISDKAEKLTAILTRLRFTCNLYSFFFNISKNLLKEHNISGSNASALVQKTIKLVQSTAVSCDHSLEKCFKLLEQWNKSIELGLKPTAPKPSDKDEKMMDGDYPTIMGFEPLINFMILPAGCWMRCPSIGSRPAALNFLTELIIKLRECILVSNNFYQKSFSRSLESMEQFSKYFRPKSCVLSRSFMLILYLPIRVGGMLKDEVVLSLSEYCESIMPLIKKDITKTQIVNEFINESTQIFSQIITLYGHNPMRQHEKMPELIDSFKNLQYSAYLINDILKNSFVYSWTTYYFAKLSIKYVLAGLELELFSSHEYPYVFWYLFDILYRNEKSELEYAKGLFYECQISNLDQRPGGTNSGKTSGSKAKSANAKKTKKKFLVNTSFHDKKLHLNDALRFLTGGMFLLTYGLKLQGKIKTPSTKYTNEEICFDRRFGSITGAPVFSAYIRALNRLEKLETIYSDALGCFSEARKLLESYSPDQKDCLRVCKSNMVAARLLSSNLNSFADRDVEFCFDVHPSFPTVKI